MTKRDRERFWAKVKVDPTTGCWIWLASVRTWSAEPWDGSYGAFWLGGRVERAHKVAYRILFGGWPEDGKVLLHGCDNRRCVNVLEHVRPGTQIQNVKDMLAKGRSIHQKRNGTIPQEGVHVKKERVGGKVQPGAGPHRDLPVGAPVAGGEPGDDRGGLGALGTP